MADDLDDLGQRDLVRVAIDSIDALLDALDPADRAAFLTFLAGKHHIGEPVAPRVADLS